MSPILYPVLGTAVILAVALGFELRRLIRP